MVGERQKPAGRLRSVPADRSGMTILRRAEGREDSRRSRRKNMIRLPDGRDALRIAAFLAGHPGWSAFWDKRDGVWRVAEDDPDSGLYAENAHADMVIHYMAVHS